MAEEPVLDVVGLDVTYGGRGTGRSSNGDGPTGTSPAVADFGVSVHREEAVGLIGESGSGKSSVALACLGLLPENARATADRFVVAGRDLVGVTEGAMRTLRGSSVSMVFQEPLSALNPCLRVGDQVAEAVRHEGLDRRARRRRVLELLDLVRLPDPERRLRQFPHQLSGGQRQRIVIAMAVAAHPDVLVADEPTTALDVTVQAEVLGLLADLRTELGMGILFVSHDLGVISQVCSRVLVMHRGRVVEEGTTRAVLTAPGQDYTRQLIASVPRPDTPARTQLPVGAGAER